MSEYYTWGPQDYPSQGHPRFFHRSRHQPPSTCPSPPYISGGGGSSGYHRTTWATLPTYDPNDPYQQVPAASSSSSSSPYTSYRPRHSPNSSPIDDAQWLPWARENAKARRVLAEQRRRDRRRDRQREKDYERVVADEYAKDDVIYQQHHRRMEGRRRSRSRDGAGRYERDEERERQGQKGETSAERIARMRQEQNVRISMRKSPDAEREDDQDEYNNRPRRYSGGTGAGKPGCLKRTPSRPGRHVRFV